MSSSIVSLGAGRNAAARFRAMFKGTYARWETAGWIRRQMPEGPMELAHVVIPRPPSKGTTWDNAVWERVQQHVDAIALQANGNPDEETRRLELGDPKGWTHTIVLANAESWAARIVEHTGPAPYWRMLLWRLRLAQALNLRNGLVCVIDRSGVSEQLAPINHVDERTFFRLARTPYRPANQRFARPSPEDWPAGILPEWYPPGVKVYAAPGQPGYDSSRPAYRGKRR